MSARTVSTLLFVVACLLTGCSDERPAPKSCDAECLDRVAVRSIRETLKLIYNFTLQGKPVGSQEELTPCPLGGGARVAGEAHSVAEQGATDVQLTYQLLECAYVQHDDEPEESYDVAITGEIAQSGIIAVQPTSTTALLFEGHDVSVKGTLFDPAKDYAVEDCDLRLTQNGNRLGGDFCERRVALEL
jgi:hypothetical protein